MSENEQLKAEIADLKGQLEIAHAHEKLLFALADTDQRGIVVLDQSGCCVQANATARKLFGRAEEGLIGSCIDDYMVEESKKIVAANMCSAETAPFEIVCRRADGSQFPALVQGGGGVCCSESLRVAAIQDLTQVKNDQKRLEIAHAEVKSIFDNSMVGILLLRGGKWIHRCNKRFVEMFGYCSDTELIGQSISIFHLSEENFREFGELYFTSLVRGEVLQVEYPMKKKDGSVVWVMFSGKAVDSETPPDLDKGVVWIMEDITRRNEAEKKLVEFASRDELTGLFNRRHFLEQGKREFETFLRSSRGFSLLMLDIDHFKIINDTYGHGVGDEALRAFAKVCLKCLRSIDIMGRLGGEEFAVILPDTDKAFGLEVAERIRYEVEFAVHGPESEVPPMKVSIGVATVREGVSCFEELLRESDKALYLAKNSGRNRVETITAP